MNFTKQQYGVLAGVGIVCLGLGFGGGMTYAKQKPLSFGDTRGAQQFQRGDRAGFQGGANGGQFGGRGGAGGTGTADGSARFMRGGGAAGEVISVKDDSFTVKMPDGGSRIVVTTDKTEYAQTSTADRAIVKEGANVLVQGSSNTDGSVTATNVSLRPEGSWMGGGMMGGTAPQGAPAQTK